MEHGVDLVLAERALEQRAVADVAADHADPLEQAGADQLALGHPVAQQADHVGAELDQAPHQPAAEQAGRAGHEDGAVAPPAGVHAHTFHGASPELHRRSR